MTLKTRIMTENLAGQRRRNAMRTLTIRSLAGCGLLAGCLMFAGTTLALAQGEPHAKNVPTRSGENPPSLTQVVALDECDPVTFNAALGPDFCKNIALGYVTTFDNLLAKAAAGTPDPGWDFEPDTVKIKRRNHS